MKEAADAVSQTTKNADELTGQLHHPISNPIFTELKKLPNIDENFKKKYREFTTRAIDSDAHRGYQQWHRDLDMYMANWVKHNQNVNKQDFLNGLRKQYTTNPDIAKKIS